MSALDWIVLCGTLALIIIYGIWKSRKQKDLDSYLLGDRSLPWYHVMFSVMATQASAITFLSAPGQAYTDGMRFVQYYFGLPLAIIVICAIFIPVYHRLKVYTAYEFLEQRFDLKTRLLTAFLFLVQRGLAAGLTIYAPALVLSSIFGWNIYFTNLVMGGLVIVYTVAGGSKAVSYTQLQQMLVILAGMFLAGWMIVHLLPEKVSFNDALNVAGSMDKLNVITTEFNLNDKYNIWSGLIGGFFLALSYFGTDQSQVGRYLTARSLSQSRTGMLMNAIVKIPMQFSILLIGALLFVFYQFNERPVFFNESALTGVKNSTYAQQFESIESEYKILNDKKQNTVYDLISAKNSNDEIKIAAAENQMHEYESSLKSKRTEAIELIKVADPSADTNDTNYIFLHFVINYLPAGLIGLLIAVIFCASWSSTASELNALASTTIVDFYKRLSPKNYSDKKMVIVSRLATILWGLIAIGVAMFANKMGSLIEAVNILGSLFYGTILGIFLTAFLLKKIKGNAVFYAAIITEMIVILLFCFDTVAFLWLNIIGCMLVMSIATILEVFVKNRH